MATKASSLAGVLETKVEVRSSTEKFRDMFVDQLQNLSDVSPSIIQGSELHEGEIGQVGATLNWDYVLDGKVRVAKERIESIDLENNKVTSRVLEGDLMKEYKSFLTTLQVIPKKGGSGSIAHWRFDYEKVSEEVAHPETIAQLMIQLSKEIDDHLISQ